MAPASGGGWGRDAAVFGAPDATAGALCEVLGAPAVADATSGFRWMVLPRHGRRPAAFLGRELLRADSSAGSRGGSDEWADIHIYELAEAGFVTAVRHLRAADGLPRWQDAWATENAGATVARLQAHDAGLGLGAQQAARQRSAWSGLLEALFGLGDRA